MRVIFSTILFFTTIIVLSQDGKIEKFITNKNYQEVFNQFDINLNKDRTKFIFNGYITDLGKIGDDINHLSQVTSVDKKYFTSAMSFRAYNKNDDKSYFYRFPINDKKFNFKYFNSKKLREKSNVMVKISTTIYRTKNSSIIIIDCVKLVN